MRLQQVFDCSCFVIGMSHCLFNIMVSFIHANGLFNVYFHGLLRILGFQPMDNNFSCHGLPSFTVKLGCFIAKSVLNKFRHCLEACHMGHISGFVQEFWDHAELRKRKWHLSKSFYKNKKHISNVLDKRGWDTAMGTFRTLSGSARGKTMFWILSDQHGTILDNFQLHAHFSDIFLTFFWDQHGKNDSFWTIFGTSMRRKTFLDIFRGPAQKRFLDTFKLHKPLRRHFSEIFWDRYGEKDIFRTFFGISTGGKTFFGCFWGACTG